MKLLLVVKKVIMKLLMDRVKVISVLVMMFGMISGRVIRWKFC